MLQSTNQTIREIMEMLRDFQCNGRRASKRVTQRKDRTGSSACILKYSEAQPSRGIARRGVYSSMNEVVQAVPPFSRFTSIPRAVAGFRVVEEIQDTSR